MAIIDEAHSLAGAITKIRRLEESGEWRSQNTRYTSKWIEENIPTKYDDVFQNFSEFFKDYFKAYQKLGRHASTIGMYAFNTYFPLSLDGESWVFLKKEAESLVHDSFRSPWLRAQRYIRTINEAPYLTFMEFESKELINYIRKYIPDYPMILFPIKPFIDNETEKSIRNMNKAYGPDPLLNMILFSVWLHEDVNKKMKCFTDPRFVEDKSMFSVCGPTAIINNNGVVRPLFVDFDTFITCMILSIQPFL